MTGNLAHMMVADELGLVEQDRFQLADTPLALRWWMVDFQQVVVIASGGFGDLLRSDHNLEGHL